MDLPLDPVLVSFCSSFLIFTILAQVALTDEVFDLILQVIARRRGMSMGVVVYAELFFVSTYFPAFTEEEFEKVIDDYNNRDRRFGGIK